MEQMGPSLQKMINFCGGKFSMKTSIMCGLQVLKQLENLHKIGFVHRDIKPSNITLGFGKNTCKLYLIDLGLSNSLYDCQSS